MWSWAYHGGLTPPQPRVWQRQGVGRGTAEALPLPVLLPPARQHRGSALRGPSTLGQGGCSVPRRDTAPGTGTAAWAGRPPNILRSSALSKQVGLSETA